MKIIVDSKIKRCYHMKVADSSEKQFEINFEKLLTRCSGRDNMNKQSRNT